MGISLKTSSIIEDAILAAFDDKSAVAYAIVDASEEGNHVFVSITIEYGKNLLFPIYLETINGEVKASFTIPSALRFMVAMNLEIDSDKVLADSVLSGTSIGFDRFSMSVKPNEDEWKAAASLLYNDTLYDFTVPENAVNFDLYWHLCDKEGYSLEDRKLSYEELSKGEYTWIRDSISEVAISGTIATGADGDGGDIEISYASSDLIAQIPYSIRVVDDEGSQDIDIRRLAFRTAPDAARA